MTFTKVLVANRGEIACRIVRTARRLGYGTVAVFSDADRNAPHTRQADEAVAIGGAAAADSYLRADLLIAAAHAAGADAVHPGYGFLSENAAFAQACVDAGLVFIGPPPAAIEAMGNKAQAKQRMRTAGVPCLPGYMGDDPDDATLTAQAQLLGYPLLVKAVAGGGGRGMRRVSEPGELATALATARREATQAFGDGGLMLERWVDHARHIEVQVFADAHGHVLHLGERDCSTQRRRQKVIEEAPSPAVGPALREALGRDAVAAARAVGYRGAGTVEFIVDTQGRHHFLEMNTRLQVEHPVTEAVTGLDLVEWQLRVAAGEPLPLRQDQVSVSGHAIEVRLYAEDPYAGFAPQTGTVVLWQPDGAVPDCHGATRVEGTGEAGGGIRVDSGIAEGCEVTPWYDPLLAKVVAHGRDRDDAIRRLRAALTRSALLGLRHNARFLHALLGHPAFREATLDIGTLDRWQAEQPPLLHEPVLDDAGWVLAAAAFCWPGPAASPTDVSLLRANSVGAFDLHLQCGPERRQLRVQARQQAGLLVLLDGRSWPVEMHGWDTASGRLRLSLNGITRDHPARRVGPQLHLWHQGHPWVVSEAATGGPRDAPDSARGIRAPVAGTLSAVAVEAGQTVRSGQALVCVEAMKMDMWLHAPTDGTVMLLHVAVGQPVAHDQMLVELAPLHPSSPPTAKV